MYILQEILKLYVSFPFCSQTHETFGDVKKLVTQEFVRQGYLEFTKLPNQETPVYEVQWGQRAHAETSKKKILKFVSMV